MTFSKVEVKKQFILKSLAKLDTGIEKWWTSGEGGLKISRKSGRYLWTAPNKKRQVSEETSVSSRNHRFFKNSSKLRDNWFAVQENLKICKFLVIDPIQKC